MIARWLRAAARLGTPALLVAVLGTAACNVVADVKDASGRQKGGGRHCRGDRRRAAGGRRVPPGSDYLAELKQRVAGVAAQSFSRKLETVVIAF